MFNRESDQPMDATFLSLLSQTLIKFIPLLSLVPTAACLHWFLRQLVYYCPPSSINTVMPVCLDQLVKLSREQLCRQNHWVQVLQTK